jgi:hypothetical protein
MTMEKKKRKPAKQAGMMVRLPLHLKGPIAQLAAKNRRTIVAEIEIAVEARLMAEGIKFERGPS